MDGGTNATEVKLMDFKNKAFVLYSSIISEIWKYVHSAINIILLNSAESVLWCSIIIYKHCCKALFVKILWR